MPNRLWVFILIAFLFVTACTPTLDLRNDAFLQDTSLIDGEPCFAPCWRNMTPGETTWDEAEDLISTFEDVSNFERNRNRETGEELYDFTYGDGPQCCRIYTRDGSTLAAIWLMIAPDIIIGDVIAQYGEPQYIQARDETDEQAFVTLVYPDVPMLIYVYGSGITSGEISAESEVIGLAYLADTEMSVVLSEALFMWDGYGALRGMLTGEPVIPCADYLG